MSGISLTADASTRRSSSGGTARSGVAGAAPPRAAVEIAAVAGPAPASPSKVLRKETATLQVRERPRLASGAALQWQQLVALTRKNLTVRARAWKTNLLLVAQAVLFIALTWGVDRAVSASNQRKPSFSSAEVAKSVAVGPIPDCSNNLFMRAGQPCYTFLYAPAGDPDVEAVARGVRERNDPPIPWSHTLGLPNATAIDAWLLAHPETALAAVIFTTDGASSSSGAAGSASPTASPASAVGVMSGNAGGPGYGLGAASMDANTALLLSTSLNGSGDSSNTARALLSAQPAATAGGFAMPATAAGPPRQLGFAVQTNSSVQWFKGQYQNPNTYIQLPLQVAVEREIVRHLTGERGLSWSVGLAQFPHPSVKSPSLIGQFAPTFLFASIMFQFVLLVHDVVAEKEGRARQMMEVMGLRPLPFWTSWVLFQGLLAALEACLLVGFGYAFGFRLFTRNAFGLSFLLILLVSLAMTAFGFFVAAFLRKASAAVPCGFLLFVVAWVILIVIAFGFPFAPGYSAAAVGVFSAMPWALLAKGVQDLADASQGRNPGIPWADRFAYCQAGSSLEPGTQLAGSYWAADCVMPLGDMFWILAVQCAGFMALAIYFDAVLPDANGVRRPPWFFLTPGFWRRGRRGNLRAAAKALGEPTEAECGLSVDADVAGEAERQRKRCAAYLRQAGGGSAAAAPAEAVLLPAQLAVLPVAGDGQDVAGAAGGKRASAEGEELSLAGRPYAVEMFGLSKAYKRGGLLRRRKPFVAVRGNWLGVHQGECFCLLGPNGAGKSTTINCLTGVLPFSGGDALVCGTSIAGAGGMDRVRPLMGVCPQFDVLWEQLTGREHLLLFGAIKGLPASDRPSEAARLLEDVKLTEAAGVRAGSYSGGMKRRLSVAIALLGDPQVVYLDEPSTGLDPISRRHLWDLIDRVKGGRAVVLTTHSMEEADILGDRIGIMARGRLRCLGTSLRLKARFGSGYRVSIRVQGSSAGTANVGGSGSSSAEGSATGALGSGSSLVGAGLAHEDSDLEIQPAPLAVQPGLHPAAPPQCSGSNHSGRSGSGEPAEQAQQRDPAAARQAAGIKSLFLKQLGIKPVDESLDYVHFLVPYEHEDRLPALFGHIKAHQAALGVADVQLRLTPLEEVFLTVARKAELEHAQLEGRSEALTLAEEGVTVQVPIGADFIQTPAGHLYHIRWSQDADTGELRLRDYWSDPLSGQHISAAAAEAAAPSSSSG